MATVKHNDFIDGHLSGTRRQIDVSIRWSSGVDQYLTIVQAKDYGDPADIGVVDEFLSVVRDVKATGGILIGRSGFTRNAYTYARNTGVSLLNLHDAESANWSLHLTVPIVWIELTPTVSVKYQARFEAGDGVPAREPLSSPLTSDGGKTRINPISTFEKHWNGPTAQRMPGVVHSLVSTAPLQAFVRDVNGDIQLRPVREFSLDYTVEQKTWLGQFQPSQCRGLIDYLDKKAFTASYLPLSEIPAQRDDQWREVVDPTQVAIDIRGTVVTTTRIVLVEGGRMEEMDFQYLGPDPQPPPTEASSS